METFIDTLPDNSGEFHRPGTRWRNPTPHTIRATINIEGTHLKSLANPDLGVIPFRNYELVLAPGAEVVLNSEWTNAIQTVRDGVIVGGLAPQLVRVDGPPVQLDPGLRPSAPGAIGPDGLDARLLARASKGGRR